jgi:hypothetical protein
MVHKSHGSGATGAVEFGLVLSLTPTKPGRNIQTQTRQKFCGWKNAPHAWRFRTGNAAGREEPLADRAASCLGFQPC